MKKQLVIIGIIAILITVGLSGCNQLSNILKSRNYKKDLKRKEQRDVVL